MAIIKVIADKVYKEEYVSLDREIYYKDFALHTYPNEKKEILKVMKEGNEFKPIILKYIPYPSDEDIIKIIEAKRQKLYDLLKISKVGNFSTKKAKQYNASLIFEYLIKNTEYNCVVREESISLAKPFRKELEATNKIRRELKNLGQLLENIDDKEEKVLSKNFLELKKKSKEQHKKFYFIKTKYINTRTLRDIYNVLINHRGICVQFSFAYKYLLDGLNIESKIVGIGSDKKYKHSLLAIKRGKKYYLSDVTKGASEYNYACFEYGIEKAQQIVEGFEVNVNDILDIYGKDNKLIINFLETFNEFKIVKKGNQPIFANMEHDKNILEKFRGMVIEEPAFKKDLKETQELGK